MVLVYHQLILISAGAGEIESLSPKDKRDLFKTCPVFSRGLGKHVHFYKRQ